MSENAAATGSIRRLADGQHGSDQVVKWPGQVLLGDQDNLVIDVKMVDRTSRNRAVGRHGGQGACEEFLHGLVSLDMTVSTMRRRMVPSGPIRVTTDPHLLSLSPRARRRRKAKGK